MHLAIEPVASLEDISGKQLELLHVGKLVSLVHVTDLQKSLLNLGNQVEEG